MTDRKKPSDTPIYQLLRSEWRRFESQVETVQVSETDLLLYVFWVVEGWKEDEHEAEFYTDQWDNLYHELRSHFHARGYTAGKGDIAFMTNVVMAFALFCLGKAIVGNLDLALIYQQTLRGLEERQKDVLQQLGQIRDGIYSDALRGWMQEFMDDEEFYTMGSKMMWDEDLINAPQVRKANNIVNITENHFDSVGTFVNRPQINGREAASVLINGIPAKALPSSNIEYIEE